MQRGGGHDVFFLGLCFCFLVRKIVDGGLDYGFVRMG